jgi:hypothetical protein
MALPGYNETGDLPEGVHLATLQEVVERFGGGAKQRRAVTNRLETIHRLAIATGFLDRMLVFGSYVSDKPYPNDVDVVLVMNNDFRIEDCPADCAVLFDHAQADNELGASIFWMRPDLLFGETMDGFVSFWQSNRDGSRRGIVEIKP